jgi:hypothetical protein
MNGSGGTFTEDDGTEYRWRTHNRQLQVSYLFQLKLTFFPFY